MAGWSHCRYYEFYWMAQTPVGVINPGVLEDNNSTQSGALARSPRFLRVCVCARTLRCDALGMAAHVREMVWSVGGG